MDCGYIDPRQQYKTFIYHFLSGRAVSFSCKSGHNRDTIVSVIRSLMKGLLSFWSFVHWVDWSWTSGHLVSVWSSWEQTQLQPLQKKSTRLVFWQTNLLINPPTTLIPFLPRQHYRIWALSPLSNQTTSDEIGSLFLSSPPTIVPYKTDNGAWAVVPAITIVMSGFYFVVVPVLFWYFCLLVLPTSLCLTCFLDLD